VLADGYRLSGRAEQAEAIERELNADQDFSQVLHDFEFKVGFHGTKRLTDQEERAAFQEYAKMSAEWVARWPNLARAWSVRLSAIAGDPDFSKEEMERVGDRYLQLRTADREFPGTPMSALDVAEHWVLYGIRPRDSVKMAEEALAWLLLGQEEDSDLWAQFSAAEIKKMGEFGYDHSVWEAMRTIVDGAGQSGDFDKARRMIYQMQRWLGQNWPKKDDPTSGYFGFQVYYLESAGKFAEAQGHKLDAVALYRKALETDARYASRDLRERTKKLWAEAGGTNEGLNFATWPLAVRTLTPAPTPAPKPAPKPAEPSPLETGGETRVWFKIGKPLPDTELRDYRGKAWSASSLKGKPTFVNVWSTDCPACRQELPQVQKLYELGRARGDFQVVTFFIGSNPGEIEPLLKECGYQFPVIMADQVVQGMVRDLAAPRNWIVDRNGTLIEESLGFDNWVLDWVGAMAKHVSQAAN
jgi:pentatricopeptide repeat protein